MQSSPRIDELKQKFHENPRRYFAPLANEYRKAGDPEQAIAICRAHLAQQPGHMSGHVVYGQALYDAGRMDEAEPVFRQALALDPENLVVLRHLGDIARQRGDIREAQSWYSRALEGDPQDTEVAAYLAELAEPLSPSAPAATPLESPPVESEPATEARPEAAVMPEPAEQVVEARPDEVAEEAAEEAEEEKIPRLADDEPVEIETIKELEEPPAPVTEGESTAETPREEPKRTTPTSESTPIVTRTLAELYLRQGYLESALEIYKQLADREPHDEELKDKVEQLSRDVPEPFDFDMMSEESSLSQEATPVSSEPVAQSEEPPVQEEKSSQLWDTADSWGTDEFAGADADEMFGLSDDSFDFAPPVTSAVDPDIEPMDEQYPSEGPPEEAISEMTWAEAPSEENVPGETASAESPLREPAASIEQDAPGAKTPAMEVPLEEEAEEPAMPSETAPPAPEKRSVTVREFFATLGAMRPPESKLEELDQAVAAEDETQPEERPEPESSAAEEESYPYADDAFASLFEDAPVDPADSRAAAALSSAVAHTPAVTTPTESFRYPGQAPASAPAPVHESEDDIRKFREWLDSLANS